MKFGNIQEILEPQKKEPEECENRVTEENDSKKQESGKKQASSAEKEGNYKEQLELYGTNVDVAIIETIENIERSPGSRESRDNQKNNCGLLKKVLHGLGQACYSMVVAASASGIIFVSLGAIIELFFIAVGATQPHDIGKLILEGPILASVCAIVLGWADGKVKSKPLETLPEKELAPN